MPAPSVLPPAQPLPIAPQPSAMPLASPSPLALPPTVGIPVAAALPPSPPQAPPALKTLDLPAPLNDSAATPTAPAPLPPAKNRLQEERFIVPKTTPAAPQAELDDDSSPVLELDDEPAPTQEAKAASAETAVGDSSPPAPSQTNPPPPAAQVGTETVAAGDAADLVVAGPASESAPEAPPQKVPAPLAALAAAGLLGGVSLFVGYRLTHPASAVAPTTAAPVAAAAAAPEPTYTPPKVTFNEEHVVIAGQSSPGAPVGPAASPSVETASSSTPALDVAAPPATKHTAIRWSFRGEAFDLMTGEPVFAAKLSLVDEKGVVVGSAETGTDGRYELAVPAGSTSGYELKINRPDYMERCVDQGAGTGALRQATPDERAVLIHAAHGRPWVGTPGKTVVHDLALIPKNSEPQ